MKKAGSDFKYLISKKLWKFKGISYHWIWMLHFKALHMFFPENTNYFLPCQIIKDMKNWYEKWRHSLRNIGHRREKKLENKALEKKVHAMATQIEFLYIGNRRQQIRGFIISQLKPIALPCKQITLD